MIAKLIVHGEDRPTALARLREALAACEVVGPKSNVEFLEKLIRHPVVVEGRIDTGYLDKHLDEVLPVAQSPDIEAIAAACAACLLVDAEATRTAALASNDPHSPWAIADGWRLGHAGSRKLCLGWRDQRLDVIAHGSDGNYRIEAQGRRAIVEDARLEADWISLKLDGRSLRLRCRADANRVFTHDGEHRLSLQRLPAFRTDAGDNAAGSDRVLAPMPGRIVLIRVSAGDTVVAGQELGVMEAMKMELALKAPGAGVVAEVRVAAGDFVDGDAVLILMAEG